MTDTVVFFLPHAADFAERIARFLGADRKEYSQEDFHDAFHIYRRIVAVMSAGIIVRALAPLIRNKWEDPAVVVISPDSVFAVPLLGGHHGANTLAKELAAVGLIPVITTATETAGKESVEAIANRTTSVILNRDSTRTVNAAILAGEVPVYPIAGPSVVIAGPRVSVLLCRGEYIVGIGCRRGIMKERVLHALKAAFSETGIDSKMVLAYATTNKKKGEKGLRDAIADLFGTLIFVDDHTINKQETVTISRANYLGLKGVAEPCALAFSRHQQLILPKHVYGGVTIAIAR